MQRSSTQRLIKIAQMAVLVALSVISIQFIHIPLMPSAPFLEYNIADVFVLIGAMLLGPGYGMLTLTAASLLQTLTVSSGSGWIGFLMHMISSGVFVLIASGIYHRFGKHAKSLLIGLIAGAAAMIAVMVPLNLLFTPLYTGLPAAEIQKMLLPIFIPFNALKGVLTTVITFVLFLPLKRVLHKAKLLPEDLH